jgi:predicted nucleotidyltransferase
MNAAKLRMPQNYRLRFGPTMAERSIQLDAEHLLGVHVDVLTPNSIPQRIRDRVFLEGMPI